MNIFRIAYCYATLCLVYTVHSVQALLLKSSALEPEVFHHSTELFSKFDQITSWDVRD